jgi:hypothetical protein
MSQDTKNRICAYCGPTREKLTKDHIFPTAWYPTSTPDSVQRWTVPACYPCNQKYKRVEDKLRNSIGLCTTDEVEGSKGISELTRRAISAPDGKNEKDIEARHALKASIARNISDVDSLNEPEFLTGFGPDQPDRAGTTRAIQISGDDLRIFGEKLARGIVYYLDHLFIGDEYDVSVFQGDPLKIQEQIVLTETYGTTYSLGPGLRIKRLAAEDDNRCGFLTLEIWGRMVLWISIYKQTQSLKLVS